MIAHCVLKQGVPSILLSLQLRWDSFVPHTLPNDPDLKINTSPTHGAGASVSRTMWGPKHHLRCMQSIGLSEVTLCMMRLDICRYVSGIAEAHLPRFPNNLALLHQISGYQSFPMSKHPFHSLRDHILLNQIRVCWWLAIFQSCPSSTHALEQIALKDSSAR